MYQTFRLVVCSEAIRGKSKITGGCYTGQKWIVERIARNDGPDTYSKQYNQQFVAAFVERNLRRTLSAQPTSRIQSATQGFDGAGCVSSHCWTIFWTSILNWGYITLRTFRMHSWNESRAHIRSTLIIHRSQLVKRPAVELQQTILTCDVLRKNLRDLVLHLFVHHPAEFRSVQRELIASPRVLLFIQTLVILPYERHQRLDMCPSQSFYLGHLWL